MPKPYISMVRVPRLLKKSVSAIEDCLKTNPFGILNTDYGISYTFRDNCAYKDFLPLSEIDKYKVFMPYVFSSLEKIDLLRFYPYLEAGLFTPKIQLLFDSMAYCIINFIESVSAFICNICLEAPEPLCKFILDTVKLVYADVASECNIYKACKKYDTSVNISGCMLKMLKYQEIKYSFMVYSLSGLLNIKLKPEFRALFADRKLPSPQKSIEDGRILSQKFPVSV
jgi:hypothetical protein